jgi:hypothetical protein
MPAEKLDEGLRRIVGRVALLNLAYFGVEFSVALAIGSVSLFADSIDFLEDTSINFLILIALGWSACTDPRTCLHRSSLRGRCDRRKERGRLREGWRHMGCYDQHVRREKDVGQPSLWHITKGRRLRLAPFCF